LTAPQHTLAGAWKVPRTRDTAYIDNEARQWSLPYNDKKNGRVQFNSSFPLRSICFSVSLPSSARSHHFPTPPLLPLPPLPLPLPPPSTCRRSSGGLISFTSSPRMVPSPSNHVTLVVSNSFPTQNDLERVRGAKVQPPHHTKRKTNVEQVLHSPSDRFPICTRPLLASVLTPPPAGQTERRHGRPRRPTSSISEQATHLCSAALLHPRFTHPHQPRCTSL